MDPISAATIRYIIKAGRILEARTLLTMDDSTLAEEERHELHQELDRLQAEAEILVARAEALESEGRTEEAKACYESVLLFAADFPGIQDHLKRVEDSLSLTRAVKRRGRRSRESTPVTQRAPRTKKFVPLLGAGLAASLVVVLLFLSFSRNKPAETLPEETRQGAPAHIAAAPPASSPAEPATPMPVAIKEEKTVIPEPVRLPEEKGVQATPSLPAQPEERADKTVEPPRNEQKNRNRNESYTVQPGDSLSKIAMRQFCHQDAWKKIYQRNKEQIVDPEKLLPGIELQLNGIENHCPPAP